MKNKGEEISFSRLTESLLTEISALAKLNAVQKKQFTQEKKINVKEDNHAPVHNSLQHDSPVSVPLLTLLVDALKKDALDTTPDGLEIIADEAGEKKVDAVVALAERIKRMYANEMMQQAYMDA
ncbi:MAG: hypothetical protein WC254_06420, partial [Candidatus Woesearchaeota archaeon]